MKKTHILPLFLAIAISVSACSAPATQTIDIASIQNTAISAALTIISETQAAIPTSTPIPPTETPTQTAQPTFAPVLLVTETSAVIASLATATSGNTDPCDAPLGANPLGKRAKFRLENQTGAPITVSLYLNLTPFGQCGFRGYNLGKKDVLTITDLTQACYNVSVLVNDPQKPTKSFGYGCINNPDQWTFVITRDIVTLQGR